MKLTLPKIGDTWKTSIGSIYQILGISNGKLYLKVNGKTTEWSKIYYFKYFMNGDYRL